MVAHGPRARAGAGRWPAGLTGAGPVYGLTLLALAVAYTVLFVRAAQPRESADRVDLMAPHGRAAERALAEGRPADALAVVLQLQRAYPTDPFISYLLARVHHEMGRPQLEAAAWDDYMRRSASPSEACPDVGVAYERAGDPGAALARFRRCIELEPESSDFHADLAGALERGGREAEAAEAYRRAADLDPRNPAYAAKAAASRRQGDDQ